MDIRSLISKLENIDSLNRAPVVEAEDPAAVIAKYTDKPDMPAYIDSKDGKVKYMDNNMDTGQKTPKVMPTDWIERYAPDLAAALKSQGGNQKGYGAQQKGGLFGIKGLGNFDQGTTVNTKQAGADASSTKFIADKVKQLNALVAKLGAESGGNTDPTVGKVDYSLGGGSAPGMKLKESILREFGFDLDEADAPTFAQDVAARKAAMQPGGATEKQPGMPATRDDSVARITGQAATDSATAPAAGGKDAIIKQIQAVMAELDGVEDPEALKAIASAQKAIETASKKPDAAKPSTDTTVPGKTDAKTDGRNEMDKASDAATAKGMAAKIARLKELLRKQPGLAQAPAGTGADTRMSGPATTESILAKLRALEESFLAEDDRAEVDKLWSEIQKGLEDGTISGDMAKEVDSLGAEVNKYQQANPSKDAKPVTPDVKKKPVTPGGKAGRKNAGTTAFQNWLNSKGQKVAVDGMYGNETRTAWQSLPAQIKQSPEGMDMLGVGTAYNVIPGQGPGTMSLGDKRWLDAMTKYGFDPKTGNPVAGSTATKPSATPGAAGGASAIPADASKKEPYWVNGTRYEWNMSGGGRGQAATGKWEVTATPQDALQWNSTRYRSMNKFTGPDSAYGKTATPDATGTTATKPAAPASGAPAPMSAQQRLAQQNVERAKAKAAQLAAAGQDSGTFKQGQLQPNESVVSEDNAILAMIRSIKI
jgi:hypothetical protein